MCVALAASVAEASGQTVQDRPAWTFGGTLGGGQTWDDEGSIGRGWLAGAYADRRISRNVDLELSADVLWHDRFTGPSSFQAEGRTAYLSAALIRRFGPPRSNVFLLGGGTIAIHRGTAGFADEPVQADTDGTHPGYVFGGGFSFRAARNIEIAPIVRFTVLSIDVDSDPATSYMLGVRVGF
jgi:hypothetical protein